MVLSQDWRAHVWAGNAGLSQNIHCYKALEDPWALVKVTACCEENLLLTQKQQFRRTLKYACHGTHFYCGEHLLCTAWKHLLSIEADGLLAGAGRNRRWSSSREDRTCGTHRLE